MLSLLKQLFSFRNGPHAMVTVLDEDSDSPYSHRINKLSLWYLCCGCVIAVIIIAALLFRFTPLKNLLFNYHELKQSALSIQHKIALMEDTLQARNRQLQEMKKIMLSGEKLKSDAGEQSQGANTSDQAQHVVNNPAVPVPVKQTTVNTKLQIPENSKLVKNLFDQAPDFPAFYPVEGTLTRGFNVDNGHYGIDIATDSGTPFRAIADGVIVSEEWTFNYGYVIVIQHAKGIITVIKHARTLRRTTGQIVQQGDIIGTVGDVGILSSGPHLHLEIWKNGIPQNPEHYLINPKQNK